MCLVTDFCTNSNDISDILNPHTKKCLELKGQKEVERSSSGQDNCVVKLDIVTGIVPTIS